MDRMLRVNELLKREISQVFERLVCDRTSALVTVTEVRTAPDLRTAQVFVSVYGSDQQKADVQNVMHEERPEIQRLVSRHVKLKYTPKLDFRLDDHLDKADRMFQLLENLDTEEDDEPTD